MNPNDDANLPQEPIRLPPARRRRARRSLAPISNDERATVLNRLARRAFPSLEFFLFSLLCGAILGAGYLLDSQSLLVFGILLAPLMTPWVGLTLASVAGSGRFFFQTIISLFIGGVLILIAGILAGLAARIWLPLPLTQAMLHSRLWWPNLLVLAIGAVLLVVSFVRSEEKPVLPSVMLTFELYLPLSAAGFGLGSNTAGLWPEGLLVFLVHLALATLLGMITLAILRFRPLSSVGYLVGILVGLLSFIVLVIFSGLGSILADRVFPPSPTPTLTQTVTPTPRRTPTPSPTATGPTATSSLQIPATETPTVTLTPLPTPVYARINAINGRGANVRAEPGEDSTIVASLINDTLVEVIVPDLQIIDGVIWVHIRTSTGIEGWVMQSLLATATPAPGW